MIDNDDTILSKNTLANLYQRYWTGLCTYIRAQFGGGPPEPEDVAQQVFEKFSALDQTTEVRNPKAFLNQIAHNIVISEKRRIATRNKHAHSVQNEDLHNKGYELSPERVFIAREEFSVVEDIIRQMPRKRRRMLLMNRIHNLSYAEIARRFGVSDTAVKKQVYKAISQLDDTLKKHKMS